MPLNNCINYNCGETPPHDNEIDLCNSLTRQSGASKIVLIECNDVTIIDTSGGAGLATQITNAVALGTAILVENISFGFEKPTPVKAQKRRNACSAVPTITYNRTAIWEDTNVTFGNADFYDAIKNRTYGGIIVITCPTEDLEDVAFWIDREVTISEDLSNGIDTSTEMFYTANVEWSSKADPMMIPAPTGI